MLLAWAYSSSSSTRTQIRRSTAYGFMSLSDWNPLRISLYRQIRVQDADRYSGSAAGGIPAEPGRPLLPCRHRCDRVPLDADETTPGL